MDPSEQASSPKSSNTDEKKCESDTDAVLTMGEFIQEMEHEEKVAQVLLGAQDGSVCTYPEGYKPRQALFACLTCTPEPITAGICYGCSEHCHEGHDIQELYTKRSFKCDCGNSKFAERKCQLYEEKSENNEFNLYNHNYNGRFCLCDDIYPSDKNDEDMLQCEVCEDWYHPSHINMNDSDNPKSTNPDTNPVSLICPGCVKKLPFLRNFKSDNSDVVCLSAIPSIDDDKEDQPPLLIEKLRSRICHCSDCKKIYESHGCEFLLDEEDDLSKFEQEGIRQSEENRPSEEDDMRGLIKEVGREGAIQFIGAVDHMKRKLHEWLEEAGSNGKIVKEEDVKKFFSDLKEEHNEAKRARMSES